MAKCDATPLSGVSRKAAVIPIKGGDGWPFKGINRDIYDALTDGQKIEVQGIVRRFILDFEPIVANRASARQSAQIYTFSNKNNGV